MKKQLSILGILMTLLLVGCSKDSNTSAHDTVTGQWKLVNVSGTFAGINNDFPEGMITWDFNPITQTVTVTNNNTDSNLWDVLETGVYNYHFANNPGMPCSESIYINGAEYGCYSIANDSLVIDQSIADGFAITLKH
ncbi:hypothetical protein [Flavobacterium sangjuense]|uniref:Lipocalin-like domain-containing protein n=1 Tax=Flavobacterium sangjuense TaxID=2518177 RepID=A0A4P7PVK4_9FLAO|nr:hypothetical protein [Flavobacterium sangjuense]QBZ97943.1 hypothetical protein GS03_01441 [Flavobacterium sangjuense]